MGKAKTNCSDRPTDLVDLEEASEALDIPRDLLWELLQQDGFGVLGLVDVPDLEEPSSASVAGPAPAAPAGQLPPPVGASGNAAEVEALRKQLELAKAELEKLSQPLWVRLRTIQHEHDQAVFEARLAKGQLSDAKARLAHSEETLAVLRRDLAKALERAQPPGGKR